MKDEVVLHWHHIVPKYEGGSDDPSNLVQLTVEDHAIAHFVRWKMYGDNRDRAAYRVLNGLIDGEEFRRQGCKETQHRLMREGKHNFQKMNAAHYPHVRKIHSERMKGNTLGSLRNITPEFRKIQADGARGNTNVRGTVWVINSEGNRRRVHPNQIPEGYKRGSK